MTKALLNILFWSLTFIILPSEIISQDITVQYHQVNISDYKLIKTIGEHNDNIITVVKYGFEKYKLEKHNSKLKKQISSDIELNREGKRLSYWDSYIIDNRIYIFQVFRNNVNHKKYLLCQEYDINTLLATKNYYVLGEVNSKNIDKEGTFKISFSPNKKSFIIRSKYYSNKLIKRKVFYNVFDKNMKKLWKEKIASPYAINLFKVIDYTIDNSGNLYIVGNLYKNSKETYCNSCKYRSIIIGLGAEKFEYEIEKEDRNIYQLKLKTNDSNLFCIGFYANKGENKLTGSYFLSYNLKSYEENLYSFQEFFKELFYDKLSEEEADWVEANTDVEEDSEEDIESDEEEELEDENKSIKIDKLKVNEILFRSNDNVIIVAEQSYYNQYNTIIIICFNRNGEFNWIEYIPKIQLGSSIASSYYLFEIANTIHFLYNDHPKNALVNTKRIKPSIYYANNKYSVLMHCIIDNNGNLSKKAVLNLTIEKLIVLPKKAYQLESKTEVFFNAIGSKPRTYIIGME